MDWPNPKFIHNIAYRFLVTQKIVHFCAEDAKKSIYIETISLARTPEPDAVYRFLQFPRLYI